MQPIPVEFEEGNYRYAQVVREGMFAIYRQSHKQGRVHRYEVVRIRVRPEYTWPDGRVTPEREAYPGASAWGGKEAHTCFTLAEAQAMLVEMQQATTSDADPEVPPEEG